MKSANVHEAKTNLSRLLDAAAAGEDVVILRNGTRFAIRPLPPVDRSALFGALAGQIHFADDYDEADAIVEAMFSESVNRPFDEPA